MWYSVQKVLHFLLMKVNDRIEWEEETRRNRRAGK